MNIRLETKHSKHSMLCILMIFCLDNYAAICLIRCAVRYCVGCDLYTLCTCVNVKHLGVSVTNRTYHCIADRYTGDGFRRGNATGSQTAKPIYRNKCPERAIDLISFFPLAALMVEHFVNVKESLGNLIDSDGNDKTHAVYEVRRRRRQRPTRTESNS